jgi:hypothetical protein
MFSQKSATITHKLTSILKKMGLPLAVVMMLSEGAIALAKPVIKPQVPNSTGFDTLVDLLNNQLPDLSTGNDSSSSDEPEVIVEGEEDENGDIIIGNDDPRFTCNLDNGKYTVMYHPESQPTEAYPWAIPSQMGGGWDPQRRCEVISSRLEQYRPDGLVELTTSKMNGYDILCVTTDANPECRIVLTVPVGQDPIATRDEVFDALTVADSGQQTQGVYTFTEGDNPLNNSLEGILNGDLSILNQTLGGNSNLRLSGNGIYLKPFLAPQDGGTGAYLHHNNSADQDTTGRQLNPNIFR